MFASLRIPAGSSIYFIPSLLQRIMRILQVKIRSLISLEMLLVGCVECPVVGLGAVTWSLLDSVRCRGVLRGVLRTVNKLGFIVTGDDIPGKTHFSERNDKLKM